MRLNLSLCLPVICHRSSLDVSLRKLVYFLTIKKNDISGFLQAHLLFYLVLRIGYDPT